MGWRQLAGWRAAEYSEQASGSRGCIPGEDQADLSPPPQRPKGPRPPQHREVTHGRAGRGASPNTQVHVGQDRPSSEQCIQVPHGDTSALRGSQRS